MRTSVTGVGALRARLASVPGALTRAGRRSVDDTLDIVVREAQGFAPVDSGDLRSTIRKEMEPTGAEGALVAGGIPGASGRMVNHAAVVEDGRRDQPNYPRQPYARPAAELHRVTLKRTVARETAAELRKGGAR